MMGTLLMEYSRRNGVKKFVAVSTICAYPKFTPVPFKEEDLWNGYPEETNAPYGIAKKALLVQLQSYRQQYGLNGIFLLPVNLYGPYDNFDPESSHVIPALIQKFQDAIKSNPNCHEPVTLWGDGSPTREFLYIEDAASAIVMAAQHYDGDEPVNIGCSHEISISDLVKKTALLMGYRGEFFWDKTKPNGQPRRKLDVSRAEKYFNFRAKTNLDEGLKKTIDWFLTCH
jgi:GDP-L-fucose synthase